MKELEKVFPFVIISLNLLNFSVDSVLLLLEEN